MRLREVKKLAKGTQLTSDCVRIALRQPVSGPQMVTPPQKCTGRAREGNRTENMPGLVFNSSCSPHLSTRLGIVSLRSQIIQENPVQFTPKPVFFPFYQQFSNFVKKKKKKH